MNTIVLLAKKFNIEIPQEIIILDAFKYLEDELADCFHHNCEFGIFPYFTKEERPIDFQYFFPFYFTRNDVGDWNVYLMNLHPNAKEEQDKYAVRRVICGKKETIKFLKLKQNVIRIPEPNDFVNITY